MAAVLWERWFCKADQLRCRTVTSSAEYPLPHAPWYSSGPSEMSRVFSGFDIAEKPSPTEKKTYGRLIVTVNTKEVKA
jgi:hypothetical protein